MAVKLQSSDSRLVNLAAFGLCMWYDKYIRIKKFNSFQPVALPPLLVFWNEKLFFRSRSIFNYHSLDKLSDFKFWRLSSRMKRRLSGLPGELCRKNWPSSLVPSSKNIFLVIYSGNWSQISIHPLQNLNYLSCNIIYGWGEGEGDIMAVILSQYTCDILLYQMNYMY